MQRKYRIEIGKVYGRLKAIRAIRRYSHEGKQMREAALFECQCGKIVRRTVVTVLRGNTRSCQCLRLVARAANGRKNRLVHGQARRGRVSPTFISWWSMIQRCMNPNSPNWKHYGAKGVKVAKRWLVFSNFLADMGPRRPGTSLSRKGDTGNYGPGLGVRWQTIRGQHKEAAHKRRREATA